MPFCCIFGTSKSFEKNVDGQSFNIIIWFSLFLSFHVLLWVWFKVLNVVFNLKMCNLTSPHVLGIIFLVLITNLPLILHSNCPSPWKFTDERSLILLLLVNWVLLLYKNWNWGIKSDQVTCFRSAMWYLYAEVDMLMAKFGKRNRWHFIWWYQGALCCLLHGDVFLCDASCLNLEECMGSSCFN